MQAQSTMNPWRLIGWSIAALILIVPAIAMQFTDEVAWSAFDFVFAAVMVGGTGLVLELTVRKSGNWNYRAAAGAGLAAAFLLIWVNGAVGIIGSENNPANLMYGGVLAIAALGSLLARFRARGMSRAMFAAAAATVAVAVIAVAGNLGGPEAGAEILGGSGIFAFLFAASGVLFRNAADDAR